MSHKACDMIERRQTSSPENLNTTMETSHVAHYRKYGDTFATQHAVVHNGDNLYFHQCLDALQHEVAKIQASLAYPGMHDRYEQLREAVEGTFEWILNPTAAYGAAPEHDEAVAWKRQAMATFIQWYKSGTDLFWIRGKPGSGKSTLMKYLVENTASAGISPDECHVLNLSFFFCIRGQEISRSGSGCLRSLLCQLLQNLETQQVAVQICRAHAQGLWTERRLRETLLGIIGQLRRPVKLFIDGLDESKDHDEVLSLLEALSIADNLKICVSSRPEVILATRLQVCPHICLEDINTIDIQILVQGKFFNCDKFASKSTTTKLRHETEVRQLAQLIESRSSGVFLWVHLVVKDLLKGMSSGDDMQTLSRRLDRLPTDVSSLYEDMLRRAGDDEPFYREDTAKYLALALHREFNALEFCLAMDDKLRYKYLQASIFETSTNIESDFDYSLTTKRIIARTAGLLDITDSIRNYPTASSGLARYRRHKVVFIHRTVVDFLEFTAAGNSLLDISTNTPDKISRICIDSSFIYGLVLPILQRQVLTAAWLRVVLMVCDRCPDEEVFSEMNGRSLDIMQSPFCAGLLNLNEDYIAMTILYPGSVLIWVSPPGVPSSHHTKIDLAPIFLATDRCSLVKQWLIKRGFMDDKKYMSTFLTLVCSSALLNDTDDEKYWLLIEWLIAHGVSVHESVELKSGETLYLAGALISNLRSTGPAVASKQRLLNILGSSFNELAAPATALCYFCHEGWFKCKSKVAKTENMSDPSYAVWGSYHALRADDINIDLGDRSVVVTPSTSAPGIDRGLIICRILGRTAVPELFIVSDKHAQLVGEIVRKTRIFVFWAGSTAWLNKSRIARIIRVYKWRDDNPDLADVTHSIESLDTLCAELAAASFAEAMQHLGKSRQIMERFYAQEAERMARKSAYIQEGWKEWYWGSEASEH